MARDKDAAKKEGQAPDLRAFHALTDALNDHCLQVRQEALKGIIFWTGGPRPSDPNDPIKAAEAKREQRRAIEALDGLLTSHDKSTTVLARLALMMIDSTIVNNLPIMDSHVHAMNQLLRPGPRNEMQVRIDASYGLSLAWQLASSKWVANHPNPAAFVPKAGWGETIQIAIQNLDDRDETMVWWACHVIGTMGEAAKKAIPALEKLKDRLAALEKLQNQSAKPDNAAIRNKNELLKSKAEWALARCHGKEAAQLGAVNRPGQ